MPLMIDLCAGLGGASHAMRGLGWDVITLDYDLRFHCDITADVRTWVYSGRRPDLIWASPPCDEFARESMPWSKTGKIPDMSLVLACKRIIDDCNPPFWVIENVRGAIGHFLPYLGNYRYHVRAFYLWGFFPVPGKIDTSTWRNKQSFGSKQAAERAVIPMTLSSAIAFQVQNQAVLL